MKELLDHLRLDGQALSQAVLEEMYRDPFWRARFGDRGRRHADEDSAFHLRYLARAIEADAPEILVRYALWLREVLATRGMCSRHLAENFRLLAITLDAQAWPDSARAAAFVRQAQAALDYTGGDAAALQRARPAIVAHATSRTGPARQEPLANLASYLEDAIAFEAPAMWSAHVDWTAQWIERTTGSRELFARDLAALEAALAANAMPAAALEHLRLARESVARAPAA